MAKFKLPFADWMKNHTVPALEIHTKPALFFSSLVFFSTLGTASCVYAYHRGVTAILSIG